MISRVVVEKGVLVMGWNKNVQLWGYFRGTASCHSEMLVRISRFRKKAQSEANISSLWTIWLFYHTSFFLYMSPPKLLPTLMINMSKKDCRNTKLYCMLILIIYIYFFHFTIRQTWKTTGNLVKQHVISNTFKRIKIQVTVKIK